MDYRETIKRFMEDHKDINFGMGKDGPTIVDYPDGTTDEEFENAKWSKELFEHLVKEINEPLPYTICYYKDGYLYPYTWEARENSK